MLGLVRIQKLQGKKAIISLLCNKSEKVRTTGTSDNNNFKRNIGFEKYVNSVGILDSFSAKGAFFSFLNLGNLY